MPVPSRSIVVGSGVAAGEGEPPGLNGAASIGAIAGAGPTAATAGATAAAGGAAEPPPPTLPPPGAGPELPPPPLLGGVGRAAGGVALSAGAFWFWNVVVEG
jgi:hypothetical protein